MTSNYGYLWDQQEQYNKIIRDIEGIQDPEYWTEKFLLGMTSQVDEVLREIKWKKHRNEKNKHIIKQNILDELADMNKFLISMCQIWGFTSEDLTNATYEKGKILEFKHKMEFQPPLVGRNIIITDIDQTLGDYKKTFLQWIGGATLRTIAESDEQLLMDEDMEMIYPDYYKLKEQFEEEGGYRNVIPYDDAIELLRYQNTIGTYIIATTARPSQRYHRIFRDTLYWFEKLGISIDELHMMADGRVLLAYELSKMNNVILLEDDPNIIIRASKSGIKTHVRHHPYNSHLADLPNVTIYSDFGGSYGRIIFRG
jgi:hypothetical protein